jgi:ligand-binding sensor protein
MAVDAKTLDKSAISMHNFSNKERQVSMARILELALDDEVQRVFDYFSSCMRVRMVFFDSYGRMLRVGLNQPSAQFCQLVQTKLYGIEQCHRMDERQQRKAAQERTILCYTCHAGVREAIKPIFVRTQVVGYVMIGQFRTEEHTPEKVLSDWVARNLPQHMLKTAYAQLPWFSEKSVGNLLAARGRSLFWAWADGV